MIQTSLMKNQFSKLDLMGTLEATKLNAFTFKNEMAWLSFKIDKRLDLFFENHNSELKGGLPPEIEDDPNHYATYKAYCTDEVERIIIAMALANYFKPELFDRFLIKNKSLGKISQNLRQNK